MVKRRVGRKSSGAGNTADDPDSTGHDSSGKFNANELARLTRDRLKVLLKERGLPVSGTKADMVHYVSTRMIQILYTIVQSLL